MREGDIIIDTATLHPDLSSCFDGIGIEHPLLRVPHVVPWIVCRLNAHYEYLSFEVETARQTANWERLVRLHLPQNWFLVLEELQLERDRPYHEMVGRFWTDPAMYPIDSLTFSRSLGGAGERLYAMTAAERQYLGTLDQTVKVYRGCQAGLEWHPSWSLCGKVATAYAKAHQGRLLAGTIDVSNITCYFDRRGESEVIIMDPERSVKGVDVNSHLNCAS